MPSSKSKTKLDSKLVEPLREWSFAAIGTQWWIGVYEAVDDVVWRQLQDAITKHVALFDANYSRFRDDSWVMQVAQQVGSYKLPKDAEPLLKLYDQLYALTDGTVTPLIGQALSDAGYDQSYSLRPGTMRSVPPWPKVCTVADGELTTTQPVLLDFGAAGKGYLVDQIVDLLRAAGISAFCVDGSGDLYCSNVASRVGLENPDNLQQAIGVMQLANRALCASAPNRRAWENYHHIMNPHLLESPTHIKAVWVEADTTMIADGLTTALFFVEPEQLESAFSFAWAIMYADGSLRHSANFKAEFFN